MTGNRNIIAVTCDGMDGMDANVFGHFGHSPAFLFVEAVDGAIKDWRVMPNPAAEQHVPGQVPKFVRQQGADTILTGNMGEHAMKIFEHFHIHVVRGASGRVRDVVNKYLRGEDLGPIMPCGHGQGGGHGGGCGGHGGMSGRN
ncbi:MAG: NifB/NifX family molybdenum-iron cluster-binding protein [Deltaproteobacteria bacterium]|nr:NifB/NifX family molybdenum-iron cluster-binding protein [Deltaproteobacteria bacterium]